MFEKKDLEMCSNVVAALKRGQFTLTGEEALAFAQTIRWLVEVYKKIETSLQEPASTPVVKQEEKVDGDIVQSGSRRRSRR